MKKVIKLTESDLARIVRRVIEEQQSVTSTPPSKYRSAKGSKLYISEALQNKILSTVMTNLGQTYQGYDNTAPYYYVITEAYNPEKNHINVDLFLPYFNLAKPGNTFSFTNAGVLILRLNKDFTVNQEFTPSGIQFDPKHESLFMSDDQRLNLDMVKTYLDFYKEKPEQRNTKFNQVIANLTNTGNNLPFDRIEKRIADLYRTFLTNRT